ncbi:MAG: DUF4136 domain-containing protein [Pseudomonadota bacterium]
MQKNVIVAALMVLVLTACASGPSLRFDVDPNADFSSYKTYGFVAEPGTDKAGYSTLITSHFKTAIRDEMDARGYRFSDSNPDLLVNFFANVVERETTRVVTEPTVATAYYGYRFGVYRTFPSYGTTTETVSYQEGTLNVDVVDASAKQLIWEGIAEGRVRRKGMENPREAISAAIDQLFDQFPVPESS